MHRDKQPSIHALHPRVCPNLDVCVCECVEIVLQGTPSIEEIPAPPPPSSSRECVCVCVCVCVVVVVQSKLNVHGGELI